MKEDIRSFLPENVWWWTVKNRDGLLSLIVEIIFILATGVVVGIVAGQRLAKQAKTVEPSVVASSMAPVASLPVPAVPLEDKSLVSPVPSTQGEANPPATETSQQTVIDDNLSKPLSATLAMPPDTSHPAIPEAVPPPAPTSVVPSPVAPSAAYPAWQRPALPNPHIGNRPMIAVIIDDMGLDRKRTERVLQLPSPLTTSFMTYADDLSRQTSEAHRRGHELMMHVPMEPLGESNDPGPNALLTELSPAEIRLRLINDLDRFKGFVCINNHMGSKFTADGAGMGIVMEELRRRGLCFVDSRTTSQSVGLELAQKFGVAAVGRNVFLDDDGALPAVWGQIQKIEELARKNGTVIAIGHPRDATIEALTAWLPTLESKGFALVPISAVVAARQQKEMKVAKRHP